METISLRGRLTPGIWGNFPTSVQQGEHIEAHWAWGKGFPRGGPTANDPPLAASEQRILNQIFAGTLYMFTRFEYNACVLCVEYTVFVRHVLYSTAGLKYFQIWSQIIFVRILKYCRLNVYQCEISRSYILQKSCFQIHTYIYQWWTFRKSRPPNEKTFGCELRENLRFVGFNPNPGDYIN